ncbi:MAG: hypothetical protein P1P84_09550 [Deferrisomatales bacterium]|nr:hypothetical protein [Deferrisomatales bacterium]
MPSLTSIAAAACAGLLSLSTASAAQPPIPQAEVFRQVFATSEALPDYMKANAGRAVEGQGRLEAIMPRATFDSSVPDANAAVAIIHLQPGRKVTCGLLNPLTREQFGSLQEGAAVAFTGELVDAQDWGEWQTVYLGNCQLAFGEAPTSGRGE